MSDLETFRDHARRMAAATHRPECCACGLPWCCGCPRHRDGSLRHPSHPLTDRAVFELWEEHAATCPENPTAPCCEIPVTDRELWTRLADEADAFLNRHSDEVLFS